MRELTTPAAVARALSRRDGVTVRIEGERAFTDGKTITVPDLGNELDDERATLLYGYLYHETGHCRYSDFDVCRDPSQTPELRGLLNLLEDVAVEARMGREYPGCLEILTALNERVLEKRPDPFSSLLLNGLKIAAGQPLTGAPDQRPARDCFGEDVFERLAGVCGPDSGTADRLALARLLLSRLEDRIRDESAARAGALLKPLRGYLDQGERLAGMLEARHREVREGGAYLVYSREEDRLEPAPEADSDKEYFRLRERCARAGRRFAHLFRSERDERWVTGLEQGFIDARALHMVRTGGFKVFKRPMIVPRVGHETAASFLVDCSGSMRREGRIENAMAAVVLFLEALTRADVACEALGYTTRGEYEVPDELRGRYGRVDKLLTVIFKSFAEPLSSSARRRIAGYERMEMLENCDVDSLLIAHERLVRRPEPRRILFLLTDGGVCSNGDDAAGRRELARVVRAIEQAGLVEILAIDLMSGHTEGVFSRRIVVKNSEDLTAALMRGLEAHLLASAPGERARRRLGLGK